MKHGVYHASTSFLDSGSALRYARNDGHIQIQLIKNAIIEFQVVSVFDSGGAHLNVVYTVRISSNGAYGTWIDQGDNSTGDVLISGMQDLSISVWNPLEIPGTL